jgi:hydroxymethylpyrimidine pyrophosphatase-like HAD family hydrolase
MKRKKYPDNKQCHKIAVAYPNKEYRWFDCLRGVTLEAHITEYGKVIFYENSDLGKKQLPKETVEQLFRTDVRRKHRPFLHKTNHDFYTILNKDKKRYANKFQQLINHE